MSEPESPIPRQGPSADIDDARSPKTKKKKLDVLKNADGDESFTSVFQVQDQVHVEVEQVHSDEFEFLNSATRLAILHSGMHCSFFIVLRGANFMDSIIIIAKVLQTQYNHCAIGLCLWYYKTVISSIMHVVE